MTKFTLAAQNTDKANHISLFFSATEGAYQVMPGLKPTTHFLRVEVNRDTAEIKDLNAATIETERLRRSLGSRLPPHQRDEPV